MGGDQKYHEADDAYAGGCNRRPGQRGPKRHLDDK